MEELQLGDEMNHEKLQQLKGTGENQEHNEEKKGKTMLAWSKKN